MGDRASVKFKSKFEESPVFCSHWGGTDFHEAVKDFTEEILAEARGKGGVEPLFRLEPSIMMVEFIRTHFKEFEEGDRVTSCYYLGKDRSEVDDSDNGCLVVNLDLAETKPTRMYSLEQ